MALANRELIITFTKSAGAFGGQGNSSNQVVIKGAAGTPVWASCKIINAGALAGSELNLSVYGMSQALMNQLTTLGITIALNSATVPRDTVMVQAVTDNGAPATVFIGTMLNAYADYNAAPEVAFRVNANSGMANNNAPPTATSFKGTTDVATICQNTFAKAMGLNFENNGVNVKLTNPYFWGSPRQQAFACAAQAGIGMDDSLNTLAIWNAGSARKGTIPIVSPTTGLKNYPTFTAQGIIVVTKFIPDIRFKGQIEVQSSLFDQLQQTNNNRFAQQKFATITNGIWTVFGLDHDLETSPGGAWFSTAQCNNGSLTVSQST